MADSNRIERNYMIRLQNAENDVEELSDLVKHLDREIKFYRLFIDNHETRRGEMFTKAMKTFAVLNKNRDFTEKLWLKKEKKLANLKEIVKRRVKIMNAQVSQRNDLKLPISIFREESTHCQASPTRFSFTSSRLFNSSSDFRTTLPTFRLYSTFPVSFNSFIPHNHFFDF